METKKDRYPPFSPYIVNRLKNVLIYPEEGGNELPTLGYLQSGLNDLYEKTKIYEHFLQNYEEANRKTNLQGWGLDSLDLPSNGARLIPCYFHWFGTSVINYARLVGFLDGISSKVFTRQDLESAKGGEKVKAHCDAFLKSIEALEAVRFWRNKIAAHFAITDPKTRGVDKDNLALLNLTTMFPVGFSRGRFLVGQIGHSQLDKAGIAHSASLPPWSLTLVYEALLPRFFTDPMQGPTYTTLLGSQAAKN